MPRVLPLLLGASLTLPFLAQSPATFASEGATTEQAKGKERDKARRDRLRMQRNERILTREEIEAAMAPHVPAIGDCYKRHTANQENVSGRLSLEMLIRPEGTLQRLWVHTPGVKGDAIDACIQKLSKSWQFPKKPGFTNAVVPFFFQKTDVKGVGPLESCWKAKGCPEQNPKNNQRKQGK